MHSHLADGYFRSFECVSTGRPVFTMHRMTYHATASVCCGKVDADRGTAMNALTATLSLRRQALVEQRLSLSEVGLLEEEFLAVG